jgi:short-subunit dehydrogenase
MELRNAILTGGSSGIGARLAKELVRRGYRVGLVARRGELLEEQVSALRASGGEALALPADVTDEAAVRDAAERVTAEWGPLDLAIANAGIGIPTPAKRFVAADAVAVLRTNVEGTFNLFGAVVPAMVERNEGHFVGIGSISSFRGVPGGSAYSASKAAMRAFLEAARVELSSTNVDVTIVNPGFIATAMTEKNRFRMPFLMEVDEAASIIADGIEDRRKELNFPFPMVMVMRLIRILPIPLYDRVTRGFGKRRIDPERARR